MNALILSFICQKNIVAKRTRQRNRKTKTEHQSRLTVSLRIGCLIKILNSLIKIGKIADCLLFIAEFNTVCMEIVFCFHLVSTSLIVVILLFWSFRCCTSPSICQSFMGFFFRLVLLTWTSYLQRMTTAKRFYWILEKGSKNACLNIEWWMTTGKNKRPHRKMQPLNFTLKCIRMNARNHIFNEYSMDEYEFVRRIILLLCFVVFLSSFIHLVISLFSFQWPNIVN